jgi:hypothetical protein
MAADRHIRVDISGDPLATVAASLREVPPRIPTVGIVTTSTVTTRETTSTNSAGATREPVSDPTLILSAIVA